MHSANQIKLKKIELIFLIIIAMIFLNINYHYNVSDDILSYDEGDYFQAAKKGFFVNWYDADDISISEFVQMGIEAFRGTKSVQQLSDEFRKDDITIFLRHNHSPVALYPFFIVESLKLGLPIEKQMRLTNLIWGAAFVAQKLLKDPLGEMTAYEYDVTGTWAEPLVNKVSRPESNAEPAS